MALSAHAPDVENSAIRADQLRHEIEQADYAYYVLDTPAISDAEYDLLLRELREIERRHPELATPDSPTQRVAGQVAQGFRAHKHPRPMLSLANAFTHEQLDAWFERARRLAPNAQFDFVVEPKIDGLAIALTYSRGIFRVGATRGDGFQGEDVTANLRTIAQIPGSLLSEPVPDIVEIRGEVYMTAEGFDRLNEQRAEEGAALFANPRNSAAGSLRQLDPEVTRNRPLHLWAYSIGYCVGCEIESQWQSLQLLKGWGFPVNPHARHVGSMKEVHAYCDEMTGARERLEYEIDGVVVKINSVVLQEELGSVGRDPRWAIAFKFSPRQATTTLDDIQVNVGRTGSINPFALLKPVNVGGVIVRLATLHNEDDIRRKDIRIGDRVIVQRAGDVIPQVVKPIVEDRDGTQQTYHLPERCPACETPIVRPEGEAMARCPNASCPAQLYRWIEHFVSEPAMDIRGLGERLVAVLLAQELIRDPADLYSLAVERLMKVPGIQTKSATNLLQSIERSKRRPLHNVIFGLGIRFVGAQTAELLASAFHNLDALAAASTDELERVEGIGRKTAESVSAWMSGPRNQEFLDRLKAAGVTCRERPAPGAQGPLSGMTFLLTGRLDELSRGQAEGRLKALGARIAPAMSKAVDYLVVGADPGSKLETARKLGTQIRDEAWLLQLLEHGTISETDRSLGAAADL